MSNKKWNFLVADKLEAREIAEECEIEPLMALLLLSRGINDPVEIDDFMSCDGFEFDDPYLFADMENAVSRINKAIENNERIAVYGDYDVDGITSSSVLFRYLKSKGTDVINYIPDRLTEGYGMNSESIDKLYKAGVTLIITVDNGVCCHDEINYASKLGIDTVVTDHHLPSDTLPKAIAVIDPYRNDNEYEIFRDYAGVGVALKLICAMEGNISQEFIYDYCDLVALGTVADIVPLIGENRYLVKMGLKKLNNDCSLGVKALISVAGYEDKILNTSCISFAVSPRINAAGRMGSCDKSFKLLNCNDYEEALELAKQIDEINNQRKTIENDIFERACNLINNDPKSNDAPMIIVGGDNWHEGVLGIVASKLSKQYLKPAIVFSFDGDNARGSARSIGEFNLYDAVSSVSDTIDSFGGHKMALGINTKKSKILNFEKAIMKYCTEICMPDIPELDIDCKLNPVGVQIDTAQLIKRLEPFGQKNPVPVFAMMNVKIDSFSPIAAGKHMILNVSRDDVIVRIVSFGTMVENFKYQIGDIVDVAFTLDVSDFKGKPSLSVILKDIRPSTIDYDRFYNEKQLCKRFFICNDEIVHECMQCTREDVGLVYRYLRQYQQFDGTADLLLYKTGVSGYAKLEMSLRILVELGFIDIVPGTEYVISLNDIFKNNPIKGSSLFRKLNNLQ